MATPKPPAKVKAAVPVALASVVADKATTPAELMATASVSEADPIFPASGITSPAAPANTRSSADSSHRA